MNINGHLKYGAITSIVVSILSYFLYVPIIISALWLGFVTLAGSLAPDLDIGSTTSKWTARVLTLIIGFTLIQDRLTYFYDIGYTLNYSFVLGLCFIFTLIKSSKHRGFTHKYTLPCVLGVIGYYFNEPMLIVFSIGILTHYACNSMKPWNFMNWI